jgi:nucleoside-diphosphate-sugar epimerase
LTYDTQCYGDRHGKWVEADPGGVDPVGYCKPIKGYIDAIDEAANDSGKPVVRVYTGMVYGKEGWFKGLVEDMLAGKARMLKPGDNFLNLIHIDDLAALYAAVIENIETGDAFNFTDNVPVTQKDLFAHLSDMLDVKIPEALDFNGYAKKFGLMAAEAMSSNTKVSSSKTFDVLRTLPKLRRYDIGISPTLKSMGIEPRSKEETMKGAKAA